MTLSRYAAFALIAGLTTFTADAHSLIAKSLHLAATTEHSPATLRVAESTAKPAPCCNGGTIVGDD